MFGAHPGLSLQSFACLSGEISMFFRSAKSIEIGEGFCFGNEVLFRQHLGPHATGLTCFQLFGGGHGKKSHQI